MPWCPKCKAEYREEFDTCADCGVTLVEEYPEDDYDEAGDDIKKLPYDDPFFGVPFGPEEQPVFLVGVMDLEEALRIKELLVSCKITVFTIKHSDLEDCPEDELEMVDLYVPLWAFERSIEILDEDDARMEALEESDEFDFDEDDEIYDSDLEKLDGEEIDI